MIASKAPARNQNTKPRLPLDKVGEWYFVILYGCDYLSIAQTPDQLIADSKTHDDVIEWKHFRHNRPLWGESTVHRCILLTKSCDLGPRCFLSSEPEQTVVQRIDTPVVLRCRRAHYDVTGANISTCRDKSIHGQTHIYARKLGHNWFR